MTNLKMVVSGKQSTANFPQNKHFLPPDTHKKCSFFEKFDVLCFLETPILRFALLPYYRRIVVVCKISFVVRNPQYVSRKKMNGIFSVEY